MPGGQFDLAPFADDRRLLPGDARGTTAEGDFRAHRPERDALEGADPYALGGRRSSFADAGPDSTGASAAFSSARVERAFAAADRAPRPGDAAPSIAPHAGGPEAEPAGSFDPLTLLRDTPASDAAGTDADAAAGRGTKLHPLFGRGLDRSNQGPRLGARPRRHVGDGLGARGLMPAESGRGQKQFADSDSELGGTMAEAEGGPSSSSLTELMREQTRVPLYENRPSFGDANMAESDAAHPLFGDHFGEYVESPDVSPAAHLHKGAASADGYSVPGRRASYLEAAPRPARPGPAPAGTPSGRAGRPMSTSSDDDFDPEWMNGKIPDSYYSSLGLPLGGHYMDTRRHQEWNRRAVARPKPQPKRGWWKKLGSFLTGRGWR